MLLDELIAAEKKVLPKSAYAKKDSSFLMKFINLFVGLFNKKFMCEYVTTIGTTSYYPNKYLENNPSTELTAALIECHEFVHKWDYTKHPVRFVLGYLFSRKRRTEYEKRGYTMTLYIDWLLGVNPSPTSVIPYFTGPDYLYMCRDEKELKDYFTKQIEFFSSNESLFLSQPNMEPFQLARSFLAHHNFVRRTLK